MEKPAPPPTPVNIIPAKNKDKSNVTVLPHTLSPAQVASMKARWEANGESKRVAWDTARTHRNALGHIYDSYTTDSTEKRAAFQKYKEALQTEMDAAEAWSGWQEAAHPNPTTTPKVTVILPDEGNR